MVTQISLGNYKYNSKKELKEKLSGFLTNSSDGVINNAVQIGQLTDLIRMHPRALEKVGIGIKNFLVLRNYKGSGKSFAVERLDGSVERFSYKTCISGYNQNKRAKVIEAFRFSIKSQMKQYGDSLKFPITCSLSSKTIEKLSCLEVDHIYPFSLIVKDFLKENSMNLSEVEIIGNGEEVKLKSDNIAENFKKYHLYTAKYQPTLRGPNAIKGNKY